MKEIIAHVESNRNGLFSVYTAAENLPFGIIGEGFSIEDAKQNFMDTLEEMRADHLERTGDDVQVSVVFVVDMSALLAHYNNFLTLAGLSRLTGINKAQLSQYVCGTRNASAKTEARIKGALLSFASKLQADFA